MNFTNEQKLIIGLLTEIHAHLKIQDGLDAEFVQRMIQQNTSWALEFRYPGLLEENSPVPESVKFVMNVLNMWELLELEFQNFTSDQQKVVSQLAGVFGRDPKFPGFDGNNEPELLGTVRILTDDLNRWSQFSGRDLNSHAPMREGYERMLRAFEQLPQSVRYGHERVSPEQVSAVLVERTHPSKRNS